MLERKTTLAQQWLETTVAHGLAQRAADTPQDASGFA
jgi:hypothetical protein